MNARCIFSLACAAVVFPAPVFAQKPPVKVEVIVEDDDEEDFFDEKPASSEDADGVRDRAEGLQEEIETAEGVKIKTTRRRTKSKGENDNSATQVVNVIVSGSTQKQKADPKTTQAPAAAAVQQQSTTGESAPAAPKPPVAPAPKANATNTPPPAPNDCNCTVKERRRRRRKRRAYWRVPSHVQRGDVMLSTQGAWGSAGGFFGLKLEGMAGRVVGIQLRFQATGYDQDDYYRKDGPDNFLTNAEWGLPELNARDVRRAFGHLTDLNFAFHFFNKSRFDLHPTLGISHFGYDVDLREGPNLTGGSLYLKAGLGLNWHWRRLFIGVDVSWYPYEILRYALVPDEDGDREAEDVEVDDNFDERRIVTSAHVGFRF